MVKAVHTTGDDGRPIVSFDRDTARNFKEYYILAHKAKAEQFNWQGHPFLTSYAKYLVEYLEMQFGKL